MAAVITYTDLHGDAPRVFVMDVEFVTGNPVEVNAEISASVIARLKGNPWFEVLTETEAVEEVPAETKRRGRPPKAAEDKEAGE